MIRPHGLGSRLGLAALACARDTKYATRYGAGAPRFAERVWIDPRQVSRVVRDPRFRRPVSARVVDGDWDEHAMEIEQWGKFIACQRHWTEGVAWEDTGLIGSLTERLALRGPIDGLSRPSDVSRRYTELDKIYGRVQAMSELLSMKELAMQTFRGWGDILIHVGRGPELLLGRGGTIGSISHAASTSISCRHSSVRSTQRCSRHGQSRASAATTDREQRDCDAFRETVQGQRRGVSFPRALGRLIRDLCDISSPAPGDPDPVSQPDVRSKLRSALVHAPRAIQRRGCSLPSPRVKG